VITQDAPYYRAHVDLVAEGALYTRQVRQVEIRGRQTQFVVPVGFRVWSVTLDPGFLIPHWTPELRSQAKVTTPYWRALALHRQGQSDQALKTLAAALRSVPTPDRYGARFVLEMGIGQVLVDQKRWSEARTHLTSALASPIRRAEVLPWVYFYLARIAQETGDEAGLREAVQAAMSADAAHNTGAADAARTFLQKAAVPGT
jgi:tetratricopeptide (TPR) repeat protein